MFELLIDGDIGIEVTLAGVLNNLVQAGGDDLNIKVSSNGGVVGEGSAIYNALFNYQKTNNAKIHFEILGWAQSAASYITSLPGATVSVHPNSLYMYHNPWDMVVGDADKLESKAKYLDALRSAMAASYSAKSGTKIEDIRERMKEETILIGQAIIDAGFADEMVSGHVIDAAAFGSENAAEMSKKNYSQTYSRLCAMAYGIEETDSNLKKNNLHNGAHNMSDKNKTPEEIKKETDRATALASAVEAMPEKAADFQKYFGEGKSADFFNGLIASHKADADAKAAADAKKKSEENKGIDEGARATAFASAVKAMPKQIEVLQKSFSAGKSADYFSGMVANHEAAAEAKKIEDASDESAGDLDNPEPKPTGGGSAGAQAYGETGQTVKA